VRREKALSTASGKTRPGWEIVGVARSAKYNSLREAPRRMIYLPAMQLTGNDAYASWLQLQTEGDPEKLAGEVRRALVEIDPNLPVVKVETISQQLDRFTDKETLISQLSIFFSLLALLLACIGLYGVMTYTVLRLTNEIGVRMALGVQPNGVLWLVLRESLSLLGIGIVLGSLWHSPQLDCFKRSCSESSRQIRSLFSPLFLSWRQRPCWPDTSQLDLHRIDPMTALRYE